MSEISIDTLKTMLANLDDAKKYQSLRDVMETLPAPDLAAVFEDLPAEKLPVLFRLCPKDLAADVFTELAPETQQKLIDGLTDTELKAVVDELFVDDATDLVEEMPANVVKRILGQADHPPHDQRAAQVPGGLGRRRDDHRADGAAAGHDRGTGYGGHPQEWL